MSQFTPAFPKLLCWVLAVALMPGVAACTTGDAGLGAASQVTYDNEARDYGVPPTSAIRTDDMDAPTPMRVIGAQTITTLQLKDMLASSDPPVLIDVLGGMATTLPTAVSLPDAGGGTGLADSTQRTFAAQMAQLTRGDRARRVVVFCLSRVCWLSHNAAVRLVAMGYTRVYWYRGGRQAWREAALPMVPTAVSKPF